MKHCGPSELIRAIGTFLEIRTRVFLFRINHCDNRQRELSFLPEDN